MGQSKRDDCTKAEDCEHGDKSLHYYSFGGIVRTFERFGQSANDAQEGGRHSLGIVTLSETGWVLESHVGTCRNVRQSCEVAQCAV